MPKIVHVIRLSEEERKRLRKIVSTKPSKARTIRAANVLLRPFKRWTLRMIAGKYVELGYADSISNMTISRTLKKTNSSLT